MQLFFRLTPLTSFAKSIEKLVNQKHATLFLSWMAFIFWQFSFFNKFTMGSNILHSNFDNWYMYVLSRGSKLKRYVYDMVKFKGNFKRKTSTPFSYSWYLARGRISHPPTNLTSLLFQRVILNKNSENQIYLAKGS